jgi:hypothetical protein
MGTDTDDETGSESAVDVGAGTENEHGRDTDNDVADTSFVWNEVGTEDLSPHEPREGTDGPALDDDETDQQAVEGGETDRQALEEGETGQPASDTDDGSQPATLAPERYLLAGESLVERVDIGHGWIAATTHRVVVFSPDAEGRRFDAIDRPNVVGIRTTDGGDLTVLGYASRAGAYGLLLLGGWIAARAFGLGSLFAVDAGVADAPGVDGLLSMLSLAGTLLDVLVTALLVGGIVAGAAAVVLAGWYYRSRGPALVVERAGGDDVVLQLPSAAVGERAIETLERTLADELAVGS